MTTRLERTPIRDFPRPHSFHLMINHIEARPETERSNKPRKPIVECLEQPRSEANTMNESTVDITIGGLDGMFLM